MNIDLTATGKPNEEASRSRRLVVENLVIESADDF